MTFDYISRHNDIMNGLKGKTPVFQDPKLSSDTKILQMCGRFTELDASEIQVSAAAEARNFSIAVILNEAWKCSLLCLSFVSDQIMKDF